MSRLRQALAHRIYEVYRKMENGPERDRLWSMERGILFEGTPITATLERQIDSLEYKARKLKEEEADNAQ